MNKQIDGNSSAYPEEILDGDGMRVTVGGMTIRAQMAAMICAGANANTDLTGLTVEQQAQCAVAQTDALIAELNKEQNT